MKLTRDEAAFLALCLDKAAREIQANFVTPESASAFYKMSKELEAKLDVAGDDLRRHGKSSENSIVLTMARLVKRYTGNEIKERDYYQRGYDRPTNDC
jgi:hypothetical protein